VQAEVAPEARHQHGLDADRLGQVVHAALVGPLTASQQRGVVAERTQPVREAHGLDRGPADVQPGDDAQQRDSGVCVGACGHRRGG
jgi:hypothetical protein